MLMEDKVLKAWTLTGRKITGEKKPGTDSFDKETPKILNAMQGDNRINPSYFLLIQKFSSISEF